LSSADTRYSLSLRIRRFRRSYSMSITDELLISFSGCSSLAEIEDVVLRDQGLTSIEVGIEHLNVNPATNSCFYRRGCVAALDFRLHHLPTMCCHLST
jgi:hypothetical protein